MRSAFLQVFIVVAIVFGLPASPVADERETKKEARRLFIRGRWLMEEQDLDAAARTLEQSVETVATKNNLYQLGLCYRALHRYKEAVALFDRALREFSGRLGQETKEKIDQQLAEINAAVARLTVTVNLDGAEVALNGRAAGVSPLEEILVDPGVYSVVVSLDGYNAITEQVTLAAAETRVLSFDLEITKARLVIRTIQPGAEVTLDGDRLGVTPLDPVMLLEGAYSVAVRRAGFKTIEQRVELTAGRERVLRFELEPDIPAPEPPPPSVDTAPARQEKPRSLVFWSGLAGTVVMAGASGAMWAITAKKVSEYKGIIHRMDDEWTSVDYDLARGLSDDIPKLNKVAIGLSAGTGACVALMIGGLFIKADDEAPGSNRVTLSPSPGGITLSF